MYKRDKPASTIKQSERIATLCQWYIDAILNNKEDIRINTINTAIRDYQRGFFDDNFYETCKMSFEYFDNNL